MIELGLFVLLNFLGILSPGPDFAIVTRYGMSGSRRSAFLATCGIATALIIHVVCCVSGLALVLQKRPLVELSIKIFGSLYLLYLGIKLLRETKSSGDSSSQVKKGAFAAGFMVNLFNPKATIFMLSLFSLFTRAMSTLKMKVVFGATIPLLAFSWFALLSYLLTHDRVLPLVRKYQRNVLLVMGVLLTVLGVVGFLSSSAAFLAHSTSPA